MITGLFLFLFGLFWFHFQVHQDIAATVSMFLGVMFLGIYSDQAVGLWLEVKRSRRGSDG